MRLSILLIALVLALLTDSANPSYAQEQPENTQDESTPPTPLDKVEVRPSVRDDEIERRLERILLATDWFQKPRVRVEEGVAFLNGTALDEQYREWAGNLARNTRDVVAVVNQIEVATPSLWNFRPALSSLRELVRDFISILPIIGFSTVILLICGGIAMLSARLIQPLLRRRIPAPLLRQVISRAVGVLLLIFGVYLVLRISGLGRLAFSVLGGTGLIGLIIGIAFRDITENFLASVLLSIQRPFRPGDLVQISENLGLVQQLNVRTTVLMTLDGNHVQVPNSTVYKSIIRNYTSNPNRREEFTIGIGYDARIDKAQDVAVQVLSGHPAVLKDPEPWVLVDNLGSATVNLKVYFWLDGSRHSWLKVRSSVIRLIKRAFQQHDISMPDAAREVVFPKPVAVNILQESAGLPEDRSEHLPSHEEGTVTQAEARLDSESSDIQEQAKRSRSPEDSEDLLGS